MDKLLIFLETIGAIVCFCGGMFACVFVAFHTIDKTLQLITKSGSILPVVFELHKQKKFRWQKDE